MTIEKYKICISLFGEGYEDIEIEISTEDLRRAFEYDQRAIWLYIQGYYDHMKKTGQLKKRQ